MRRPLVLALLALATTAPSAGAAAPVAATVAGSTCGVAATQDLTREAGWVSLVVSGGPVATAGTIQLTCTYSLDASPAFLSMSASGTGAVYLSPTLVSLTGSFTSVRYCTTVTVSDVFGNNATYGYDDATGTLTTGSYTCPTAVRHNTCVAGACVTTWEGAPAVVKT
jgi:hypothetical protein